MPCLWCLCDATIRSQQKAINEGKENELCINDCRRGGGVRALDAVLPTNQLRDRLGNTRLLLSGIRQQRVKRVLWVHRPPVYNVCYNRARSRFTQQKMEGFRRGLSQGLHDATQTMKSEKDSFASRQLSSEGWRLYFCTKHIFPCVKQVFKL